MSVGKELFESPYREKICRGLPQLFDMVQQENRRGDRVGMEVGIARERVLISLLVYVYGWNAIKIPPTTSKEIDVIVNDEAISIKTKTGDRYRGVKLSWTVDWTKINSFVQEYRPTSHLLYVNIAWEKQGWMYLIPKHVQDRVLDFIGREEYFKKPPRGTNPRGVEISTEAMWLLQEDPASASLLIDWTRDSSIAAERVQYQRWIDCWSKF